MSKLYILVVTMSLFAGSSYAQGIAINTDGSAPHPNAILDIKATNKGVLIPRLSTTGRLAIPNTKGLLVFDTTVGVFMYNNGTAWKNISQDATGWLLNGNANTVPAHFLGTTDNRPITIKVNSEAAGILDPTTGNTAWGYRSGMVMDTNVNNSHDNTATGYAAMFNSTGGAFNTASGSNALFSNIDGFENTAIGGFALYANPGGPYNVATGYQALRSQTNITATASGSGALFSNVAFDNTALGHNTLYNVNQAVGFENTAAGHNALYSLIDGSWNVAMGSHSMYSHVSQGFSANYGAYSLFSNVSGYGNTAVGVSALYNSVRTDPFSCVAMGTYSLYQNTTGKDNWGGGCQALYFNTTGNDNAAVGFGALFNNTTGSSNTAVGAGADIASVNLSNATAIGFGAAVNASNKIRIGNSSVTVIEGQVPFTVPSDGRFKYEVREDVKGMDFIRQLRPVTYQFDTKYFDEHLRSNTVLHNGDRAIKENALSGPFNAGEIQRAYAASSAIRRSGFIAQEVEKAAVAAEYNFNGIVKPATEQDYYSLGYELFVVPLVKGVQEQQQLIAAQEQKIRSLQQYIQANDALLQQLPSLQQQVAQLRQLVNTLKTTK